MMFSAKKSITLAAALFCLGSFDAFVAEGKYVDMNFMNVPEAEDEEIPWK